MPAIRRRWTTVEVRSLMGESRAWPRYELIGGELLVTPAPRGAHQLVVDEVLAHANNMALDHWGQASFRCEGW